MPKVTDFQLIDHGLEHEQYFSGCGISMTSYNHVVTGCADNPSEAIEDCLEQMSTDADTEGLEARMLEWEGLTEWPTKPVARCDEEHYYVSLRYNLEGEQAQ